MLQNNNVRRKSGFPHMLCFSMQKILIVKHSSNYLQIGDFGMHQQWFWVLSACWRHLHCLQEEY